MKTKLIDLPDKIFVTGIGTGIGKTIVSSYLCKTYGYDYWKPIQSGDLNNSDSNYINENNPGIKIWPEQFKLNQPMSPHASAKIDGISIELKDFELPLSGKLLVEGAGGLMVPVNEKDLICDLIKYLDLPVVLVVRDYLGCINHTLLSVELLKARNIGISCIIFNGDFTESTISYFKKAFEHIQHLQLPELNQ